MKTFLAFLLIFAITFAVPSAGARPLANALSPQDEGQYQGYDQGYETYFSADQLENLVAPVALYPDPLLAQVLLAATFPDQIDEAARTVRAYGAGYAVDSTPWDVSVKAVAHYPTVLSMMADKIDWTTSLGQAYVNQSSDLMDAVQRLRKQAHSRGYLVNSRQQQIVETDGYLYIYPAQPEYIYVPYYDPAIIFAAYPGYYVSSALWFGTGFLIGAWLNHDCDWGHHRVYYHGWGGGGPVWIARSRSHIRINNIYVNDRYRNVAPNRHVLDRHVNYGALNRYNSVHRGVDYNDVRRARTDAGRRPAPVSPGNQHPDNKIIRRSIDPNDPRIESHRGRTQEPQPQVRQPDVGRPDARRPDIQQPQVQQPNIPRTEDRRRETPQVQQPQVQQPNIPRPEDRRRETPQVQQPQVQQPNIPRPEGRRRDIPQVQQPQVQQPNIPRPEGRRPDIQQQVPHTTLPAQIPRTNPAPPQPRQPDVQRQPQSVFRGGGGGGGSFDPRASSQRGQQSRQQQSHPVQQAPQAPRQQAPPQQHGQQGQPRGRGR
jgi:hypothetical protein